MTSPLSQSEKAELFRAQHLSSKMLVLPNIWDVAGAKLMELTGYQSVATASAATSVVNGYADGEKIPYDQLLSLVKKISSAVSLPVSVDMEGGFAKSIPQLKDNVRLLIENGGVGINIEDTLPEGEGIFSSSEQCRKIEAIRETGIQVGVNIVINARTDYFLLSNTENALDRAIERALSYKAAGADCIYPIFISSYDDIKKFLEETSVPANILLLKPISDLKKLENMGVSRVSIGPGLLDHTLALMKNIAEDLFKYNSDSFFNGEMLPPSFRKRLAP